MLQMFSKYAGIIQGVLGAAGTASPDIAATLGATGGGSIFNLISGAVLGYLGFKGTDAQQKIGALGIGGLNGIVGLLGAFNVTDLGGVAPGGWLGIVINLAVAAWGIYAGTKKKATAAA